MSPAIPQRGPQPSLETSVAFFINQVLNESLQNDNEAQSSGHDHDMAGRTAGELGMDDGWDKAAEQSEETQDAPMFGGSDEEDGVSGNEAGLSKEMDVAAAQTDGKGGEQSQDAQMFSGSDEEDGVLGNEARLSKEKHVAAAQAADEGGEKSEDSPMFSASDEEDGVSGNEAGLSKEKDVVAAQTDDEGSEQSDKDAKGAGKETDEETDEEAAEMDVEPVSWKAPPVRKRKQPSQQRP
jgi:hypothetical protein